MVEDTCLSSKDELLPEVVEGLQSVGVDIDSYMKLIEMVPFTQSLFQEDQFIIEDQLTPHRKLRQLLLEIHSRNVNLSTARIAADRAAAFLKDTNNQISRMRRFVGRVRDAESPIKLRPRFKIRTSNGPDVELLEVNVQDIMECYDLPSEWESCRDDIITSVETLISSKEADREGAVVGMVSTKKNIDDCSASVSNMVQKLPSVIKEVDKLEAQGIDFLTAERELYWPARMSRDVETDILHQRTGIGKGVLLSIQSLPKKQRDEVLQQAYRTNRALESGQVVDSSSSRMLAQKMEALGLNTEHLLGYDARSVTKVVLAVRGQSQDAAEKWPIEIPETCAVKRLNFADDRHEFDRKVFSVVADDAVLGELRPKDRVVIVDTVESEVKGADAVRFFDEDVEVAGLRSCSVQDFIASTKSKMSTTPALPGTQKSASSKRCLVVLFYEDPNLESDIKSAADSLASLPLNGNYGKKIIWVRADFDSQILILKKFVEQEKLDDGDVVFSISADFDSVNCEQWASAINDSISGHNTSDLVTQHLVSDLKSYVMPKVLVIIRSSSDDRESVPDLVAPSSIAVKRMFIDTEFDDAVDLVRNLATEDGLGANDRIVMWDPQKVSVNDASDALTRDISKDGLFTYSADRFLVS